MERISSLARTQEGALAAKAQLVSKEALPPEIRNFPLVYRDIKDDNVLNIYALDLGESEQMYVVEVRTTEKDDEAHKIYFIDKIGSETPGSAKLVVRRTPDDWGITDKPYIEWTMTDPDSSIRRKGLAERRAEIAHQYCTAHFGGPLYSGVELRKGTIEMWQRWEKEGKAHVVAERPSGEKRYARTMNVL